MKYSVVISKGGEMGGLSKWEDLEWMRSPHCSNPKSLPLPLLFEYHAKHGHVLIITGIKRGKKKRNCIC